jgi:hypothetical protein
MAYPSTAELVSGSTVTELTGLTTEQKDALRTEAITAVEFYCRQSFTAEGTEEDPVTLLVDGGGGRELWLPRRLATIDSLSVSTGAFGADDVTLNASHDRLHLGDAAGPSTWATRAIVAAMGTTRSVFPAGAGTVEVTGVWGWAEDEYPGEITTALRFHMEDRALADAHALADSVRSARGLGLSGLSQGSLTADLSRGEPLISTRVRRLLQRHRWSGPTGAIA